MLNKTLKATCLTIGLGFIALPASATIMVDVTGVAGSGQTTWTFSGSATVGDGTITIDNNDSSINWGWDVGALFYSGSNENIDFSTTSAQFMADGVQYEILGVGAEDDLPSEVFGIAIESVPSFGAASYTFSVGTVLTSFAGSGIASVDITEFAFGTTNASDWRTFVVEGTLPVQFNVTAVPEPGTMALLGLGLIGLGQVRRKTPA